MFVMEAAIHKASAKTGIPVHVLQELNLVKAGDSFPYGTVYTADEVRTSWNMCRRNFNLEKALLDAADFNKESRWIKKGVSMMPVCFGISFTTTFLNQASALVHVYTDGSVGISTGAVEMGQGVNSRIRRVAADVFGIPVELTRVESTNTTRNANTSPTAASSGADMNGNATLLACRKILKRILGRAATAKNCNPCDLRITDSRLTIKGELTGATWNDLVMDAYTNRISLSCHAHYATPGIYFDRTEGKGVPFAYHVAGTALTEVSVNCLLGTYKIDSVRIIHNGGTQMNPLIDLGQVEGALVQGIGWVTMEELAWDKKTKRLLSDALATYKVPDISFTPGIEVIFAEGEKLSDNVGLRGSKAIGEPPFMYGIGSWFAIANAMGSIDEYKTPMTPETVLMTLRAGS
jgi:xanthine dehydrogenase large subunit